MSVGKIFYRINCLGTIFLGDGGQYGTFVNFMIKDWRGLLIGFVNQV